MPGSQRRQGKEYLECPRHGHAAQRLEGIANDHGAVPRIEKGEMARRMSWRGNRFKGTDTVALVQQKPRLRGADGIATTQGHLRLTGIQALIPGQKTCVSLTDRHL